MLAEMTAAHVPVLAAELVESLDPQPGDVAIDCTFGAGGHARLIADKIQRFFAANSHDTELDSAGRVGFPPFLLEHAGLEKEVVVTGSGDALEIWNRATWGEYRAALTSDVTDITARLGHTA